MNNTWPVLCVCVCLSVRYSKLMVSLRAVPRICSSSELNPPCGIWLCIYCHLPSLLLFWHCAEVSPNILSRKQRFSFLQCSKKPGLILPGHAEFEYPFALLTCNLPFQVSRRVNIKLKQKVCFLMTHP